MPADDTLIAVEASSEVAAIAEGAPRAVESRTLTDDELALLTALAPLVETPREAKRLVNLYRMIRATRDLSTASRFLGGETEAGEYQAVVILLGLVSGHGGLLAAVLSAPPGGEDDPDTHGGLTRRRISETWPAFVAGLEPKDGRNVVVGALTPEAARAWQALHAGLTGATALVTLDDLEAFQRWAPRVARFSFLLSPIGASG